LVRSGAAQGVVVAFSSKVHGARDVRKVHPYQIDAFTSGDAGPVACVEEGRVRIFRPWPTGEALGVDRLPADGAAWPLVEIIASHAGATGAVARALCAAGVKGLVVACTGNGTLHCELEAALLEAAEQGIKVLRSTRTRDGRVLDTVNDKLPSAGDLTPEKARIELLLQLM
jgi:L-asparaginase